MSDNKIPEAIESLRRTIDTWRDIVDVQDVKIESLTAERDALRELLRELWDKQDLRFYDDEYLARIDAVLNGENK